MLHRASTGQSISDHLSVKIIRYFTSVKKLSLIKKTWILDMSCIL